MGAAHAHEKQTAKVDESQLLPKTTFYTNDTKLCIIRPGLIELPLFYEKW